jgi:hypothetical protein
MEAWSIFSSWDPGTWGGWTLTFGHWTLHPGLCLVFEDSTLEFGPCLSKFDSLPSNALHPLPRQPHLPRPPAHRTTSYGIMHAE